jgi:hypothetical protein
MAGFFDDISEFFSGKKQTDAETANAGANQQAQAQLASVQAQGGKTLAAGEALTNTGVSGVNQATQNIGESSQNAERLAAGYNQGAQESMGANAQDYMRKANAAAQGQADQSAQAGSTASARQQLMAARAGGLSKGQAALRAGQSAGDTYTNQYQQGLESGRSQYGQAAGQFGQMGAQQQQIGMQGRQAQGQLQSGIMQGGLQQQGMGLGAQTQGAAAQAAQATAAAQAAQARADKQGAAGGGAFSGILSGVGSILSDRNQKSDIVDSMLSKLRGEKDDLQELVENVQPVDYNYKPGSGEDPTKERKGVLAQDLEKTGMRDNVQDTPQGKMVDTGQQTLSNTNLIVQMAQKLFDMEAELKALRAGK